MILFDSSVVTDARDSDSPFHDWAKPQIAAAVQEGGAVNTIFVSARRESGRCPGIARRLGSQARAVTDFSGDSSRKSICHLLFGPIEEGGKKTGKPCAFAGLPDRRSCQGR